MGSGCFFDVGAEGGGGGCMIHGGRSQSQKSPCHCANGAGDHVGCVPGTGRHDRVHGSLVHVGVWWG